MPQYQPENVEAAPLSAGGRAHWLEEALQVSEWLEDLCLAAAEMDSLWWWRLGGRMRMVRAGADGPLGQVAVWRGEAVLLQHALLDRLESGTLDQNAAQDGLARLTELVPAMHREILRAAESSWWRVGLVVFRLTEVLGLGKPGLRSFSRDAAAVMARFRRWKALPEPGRAGAFEVSPMSPPPKAWRKSRFHQLVLPLEEQGAWPVFGAAFRASEGRLAAERREIAPADRPLVTVIMAGRNRAEEIAGAVHSVMDQTWPDWELIVCDDGSDDGTADAACAAGDGRVRALRLAHGGTALARNRGLFEARGEYIAYLDTDNLWHPAYLETMVRTLEEQRGRWCAFARCVDAERNASGGLRLRSGRALQFSHERLAERNFIELNSFFHRAELPRLFGGFTESLPRHQNWDLVLKYSFAQDPAYVDRYLTLCRRNAARTPSASAPGDRDEISKAAVAENLRSYYAGGLAGPGRGAQRRVTVVTCDLRPEDVPRGRALAAALRAAGFDAQDYCIVAGKPSENKPWDPYDHLAAVAGGVVLCVGTHPYALRLALAASAEYGEGVVLDLTGQDVDDRGSIARKADEIAVWTTGNPRVHRLLKGRATFLGGYEGECLLDNRPEARRVLWAGRPDAQARPTPAELALRVDLPEDVITDRPAERWSAALFWPVMVPRPAYRVDPFTLARAFATGVPVILGDPAGPDELARQETVRWVNPEDDDALRDALEEALDRRGAARERAANAQRLFQRQYSVRAAAAQFAVIWERSMAAAAKTKSPTVRPRSRK